MQEEKSKLNVQSHIQYFIMHLKCLPHFYSSQDTNRLTIAFFCISGLDILKALDKIENKQHIIDWVYSLQVLPRDLNDENAKNAGFIGGSYLGLPFNESEKRKMNIPYYYQGHLAMTYVALAILKILGDDLSRVNKKAIINSLKYLQKEDGGFEPTESKSDQDMRFMYCACCVSALLNDWSGIDKEKAIKNILAAQRYDHAFAKTEGMEAHGGYTFCAIASLALMNSLDLLPNKEGLIQWCVNRQIGGLNGRPHKNQDTCYSWWVGATLANLNMIHLIDYEACQAFTMACQHEKGGIAKEPDAYPDPLHTYMALSGLSLQGFKGLNPVHPGLNITLRCLK